MLFSCNSLAIADILVMITEGDGSATFAMSGQSELCSDIISATEAKLPSEARTDLTTHLADIMSDVADVVDGIVSIVAAADGTICTNAVTTSLASNTFDCQSTPVYSTTVSASADDTADDVKLVEVQLTGYYYVIYNVVNVFQ